MANFDGQWNWAGKCLEDLAKNIPLVVSGLHLQRQTMWF